MTDCEKYIEMMSAMIDGELSQEQEAELHAHIEQCADCGKVYEAFKGISGALSEELATPPEALVKGVMYKIGVQKRASRRFSFGKFTALAACLALILLGASHFGLFNGGSKISESSKSLAAPKAMENKNAAVSSVSPSGGALEDNQEILMTSDGDASKAGEPAAGARLAPQTGCEDGTVLQFGFTTQNLMTITATASADEVKEPEFLFDAKEIMVYEGKYYLDEADTEKNKYLFTLTTEDDRKAVYDLVTAMPDNSVEYTQEDGEIIKSDPLYTLYVPVDTEKDKDAKDKLICVWIVNGEVWCVISDAELPDPTQNITKEKILYKAEGVQDKFEKAFADIKKSKGIT